MAAFWHRTLEEKADRIIIVTDVGQSVHFKMIYAAAIKAGYIDPKKTQFDHVTFGLVIGPDGKKFKTRECETEKLLDLLVKAVFHAKKILKQRNPDLSIEEIDVLSIRDFKKRLDPEILMKIDELNDQDEIIFYKDGKKMEEERLKQLQELERSVNK